jgi:hypothetical protein
MTTEDRRLALQARCEGKAVQYRNRAQLLWNDAAAARYRGAEAAALRLESKARSAEATAARLCAKY